MSKQGPWRGTLDFTFIAGTESPDEASVIWDRVADAIQKITGVPVEGGSSTPMDVSDVISGSPLAARLRGEANAIGEGRE